MDFKKKAFSGPGTNITIRSNLKGSYIACMGAISERGLLGYMCLPSAFASEDVIEFLELIRPELRSSDMLFWDNASMHRSRQTRGYLEE